MKSVLITGASRGIGAEIARRFGREDYFVFINYYKNKELAEKVLSDIISLGGRAELIRCDVKDSKQVCQMFETIVKRCGKIDILINNAGISETGLISKLSEDRWDKVFDTNIKSVFLCCKKALEYMVSKKQGCIINISSIWGISGASCEVAYSASKAAVIGFTKALAKEVGPCSIRVNCIAPGVIATDMNANLNQNDLEEIKQQTPLGKIGKPHDIAELAYFLASDSAAFITGQVITADGGLTV